MSIRSLPRAERELDLHPAVLEVEPRRHERETLLAHLARRASRSRGGGAAACGHARDGGWRCSPARTRRSTRRRATPRRRGSPRTPGRAGRRRRGATSPRSRSAEAGLDALEEVVVVPRAAVLGDQLRPGHAADCRARRRRGLRPRREPRRAGVRARAACGARSSARSRRARGSRPAGIETQRTGVVARTRATRAPSSTSRASSPKKSPGPSSSLPERSSHLDVAVAEHEHAGARVALQGEHLTAGGP